MSVGTAEIRKLYVAAFEDLVTSRGYSRRRKVDPFEKQGGAWVLTVDLRPYSTFGRVKTDLLFRGTVKAFEARIAAVLGSELHDRLGSGTFLEDGGTLIPENILLELENGVQDIPNRLERIGRAIKEMEDFAEHSSRDISLLCHAGAVGNLRRGFACWELGDAAGAARYLEEKVGHGPPEVREASAVLLERVARGEEAPSNWRPSGVTLLAFDENLLTGCQPSPNEAYRRRARHLATWRQIRLNQCDGESEVPGRGLFKGVVGIGAVAGKY